MGEEAGFLGEEAGLGATGADALAVAAVLLALAFVRGGSALGAALGSADSARDFTEVVFDADARARGFAVMDDV